jgi:hypothetical protein
VTDLVIVDSGTVLLAGRPVSEASSALVTVWSLPRYERHNYLPVRR